MKRPATYLTLLLVTLISTAQNWETKSMLKKIEGEWKIDEQKNVVYTRIVEVGDLSKSEIYTRVHNYFTYYYGSGRSMIQTQDLELGRISGKGLYHGVYGKWDGNYRINAWHSAIVDIKEGRAKVVILLTDYEKIFDGSPNDFSSNERRIVKIGEQFPINRNGYEKNKMGQSLANAHYHALKTLDALEVTIREGKTDTELDNVDW